LKAPYFETRRRPDSLRHIFKGEIEMKSITQRTAALALTLVLAFAAVATAAPKSERSRKYISLSGKVLQINNEARTMLVADTWSPKLYLVTVPKGETFKITFGMNMKKSEAQFEDTHRNDRITVRGYRGEEHLARLEDGREVVLLTASR
jgi:hypothetical protein